MKKILKFLMFPMLLVSSMQFSSCKGLHIHDLEWKYNEEKHWQECKNCHEKIGEVEHSMNDYTDRCFICDYHDPIIKTNGSATLTGLTKHGKKKETIALDNNILVIAKGSFDESECTKIRISKDFIAVEQGSLINSKVKEIVDPEEGFIEWQYYDGYYFRKDMIAENEAMIKDGENTKYYKTLKDAIDSVEKNDVTITLLRQEIELPEGDIDIKNTITFEPLYSEGCVIKDDAGKTKFYIHPTGCLKIPMTITFTSPTRLILGPTSESRGESSPEEVYTSGSLVYFTSDSEQEAPQGPSSIEYVDSNKQTPGTGYFNACMSKQITGSTISETYNYAYGVLKMDKDFKSIKGLTDFGATCTKLTISRPIENRDFNIAERSFVVKGEIHVPVPILPDPRIKLWKQKGSYSDLIIGDGITSIDHEAFANYIDGHIKDQVVKQIAYILCPIVNVTIGDDVKYIGDSAFNSCVSIDTVKIGMDPTKCQLNSINVAAFANCYLLKKVDLSNCINLREIWNKAFIYCSELHGISLAVKSGWHTDKNGYAYLPSDMTDENVSMFLKETYTDNLWKRDVGHDYKFAWCKNSERDAMGRFNKVHYTDSFPNSEDYDDNGEVYVFKAAGDGASLWNGNKTITKNVRITVDNEIKVKFGGEGSRLYINAGKHLIVSKNVDKNETLIMLHKKDKKSTTVFEDVGGFAQEYDGSIPPILFGAYNFNDGGIIQAESTTGVINGKKVKALGLFNFNLREEKSYDKYSNITSLSNLGKMMEHLVVTTPVIGNKINDCEVNGNAFANNSKIEKIEFSDYIKKINSSACQNCPNLKDVIIGDAIKTIGSEAFKNCPSLWRVTIYKNTVLQKIEKDAFDGCFKLRDVDFDSSPSIINGWSAGGVSISEADMKSHSKVAEYLTKQYCHVDWTRAA